MAEQGTQAVAFALSLAAGILILVSGIVILMLGTAFMSGMMGEYHEGMMGGYGSPMDGYRYPTGYFPFVAAGIGIWGIVCGIIILVGSYMLYSRPASHAAWGVVILIFSLLSVFEGGGFVIGLILGVIGGILAIVLKPPYPEGGAKESV
jgi:hypothetical protein